MVARMVKCSKSSLAKRQVRNLHLTTTALTMSAYLTALLFAGKSYVSESMYFYSVNIELILQSVYRESR